ncbi:hypothetical protein BDZ97DRAFT_2078702 [Flammula alnicola]|nr:hypothetical protein BDZ97DRAFT_2069072 [Flammula alnicola]KAF8958284.1 hypothetical protein BDZ97DRAFT_2078702 [Flammula alnicola]
MLSMHGGSGVGGRDTRPRELSRETKGQVSSHSTQDKQVQDPFSSKLPPEVVSNIFMNFLPENVDDSYIIVNCCDLNATTPLRLGSVCQAWRAIAWSTPRLCMSISIDMYNENVYIAELIRDWLDRAGHLPLYLRLWANDDAVEDFATWKVPSGDEEYIEPLISAVVAHSSHWSYLDLELSKLIMTRVRCAFQVPLKLKTLKLHLFKFDIEELNLLPGHKISLDVITSPTEMAITNLGISQIDIDWTNLTRVTAYSFSVNDCFELLQKVPWMTHCTLMGFKEERGNVQISQTLVQRRHLEI